MSLNSKTASPGRLTVPVVSKAVGGFFLPKCSEIATAEYAAAKVATRFRLTISTAREVCRMAGLAVQS